MMGNMFDVICIILCIICIALFIISVIVTISVKKKNTKTNNNNNQNEKVGDLFISDDGSMYSQFDISVPELEKKKQIVLKIHRVKEKK